MIKTNALDTLITLLTANDDDARNDDNAALARTLLINPSSTDADLQYDTDDLRDADAIRRLIELISDDRELLTTTLLDFSLCPLHRIDYAICFDDDNAECASIRTIHPSHDT